MVRQPGGGENFIRITHFTASTAPPGPGLAIPVPLQIAQPAIPGGPADPQERQVEFEELLPAALFEGRPGL
jgi:hypothetical protein